MAGKRNTQLDGWRAFAVVGVMWHHWTPKSWRGPFPFEIGLFFFLTLTGFLITRILLDERARSAAPGRVWRWPAYQQFMGRRFARLLGPYYAALALAFVVGAPDLWAHPLAYLLQVENLHMAWLADWPAGTAHFWTLALQMQFYLIWPLLVFGVPRRWLGVAFVVLAIMAPMSRMLIEARFPAIFHSEAITPSALDYFSLGALVAWAISRGMPVGDRRISWIAWLAAAGYGCLYARNQLGLPNGGFGYFQQFLLAIAFAGLISATLRGFRGPLALILDHPLAQQLGRLSYGLYLFHALAPMLVGKILPFLWWPAFDHGALAGLRLAVFAITSWGLAWLCWRWLEDGTRRQTHSRTPQPKQTEG